MIKSYHKSKKLCVLPNIRKIFFIIYFTLSPVAVFAGSQCLCTHPIVYEAADVNTAILQFTYAGNPDAELSDTARQLSLLVQLDALFSQLKYGSIGVNHVLIPKGSFEDCTPEQVIARMTGDLDSSEGIIQPGKGLVFLSGSLFERDGNIYIETQIRFFRKGDSEKLMLEIDSENHGSLDFVANLPTQTVNFSPRMLSSKDIESISETYRNYAIVRSKRDLSQIGQLIDVDVLERFGYFVTDVSDGWIEIESWTGGPSGWVNAGFGDSFYALRQKMPELDFLDAAVGYLRFRILQEHTDLRARQDIISSIETARHRYEKNTDKLLDPTPMAILKAMAGMVKVIHYGFDSPFSAGVPDLFSEIATLIPYSGDARNFKILSDIHQLQMVNKKTSSQNIVNNLLRIISIDPANDDVLNNLENLYVFLTEYRDPLAFSVDNSELKSRIEKIRKVRAALQADTIP